MRKVIVSEYVSLDGIMEEPAWTAPYWNDEIAKFKFEELFSSDMLLLGRVTYEEFASAWPQMQDEEGFADRMNSLPKVVASRTLETMEWNASRIKGSIAEEVKRLKQQPGQNILLYGSGEFVQTLLDLDLVDEYRLLVYPVVLGKGKRLFKEGCHTALELAESKPFSSGVVALTYKPAPKEAKFSAPTETA
ncbi:MAG: dihydrofolate reductase [Ardenticatenales bacterium]|nr:dihydrofolate reductase [Ardenticatenales bacterium]